MSTELAWNVLIAIAAAGAVFWMVTAVSFAALVRPPTSGDGMELPWASARGVEGPQGNHVQTGRMEVAGRPDELTAKLAEVLSRGGLSGMLVRILERTTDRVVFEVLGSILQSSAGYSGTGSNSGSRKVIRGEVVFRSAGSSRSTADFALETGAGRGLIVGGTVFLILGLIGLIVGFVLLSTLVVSSPNPGVRAQVAQMVQCIHLLWPPWLFAMMYLRGRNTLRNALEVLLGNLPYA